MHSLRTKFIIVILLIITIILGVSSYLLIEQKKEELTQDIYRNGLSFARLTADPIMDSFSLNYVSGGFSFFRRDILNQFNLNHDIARIQIAHKAGFLSFDSEKEQDKKYEGETRIIEDENKLARISANLISVKLESGKVVYLEIDEEGNVTSVDENGKLVEAVSGKEKISDIVLPYSNNKHSIVYKVSYDLLAERVLRTIMDILVLTIILFVFGVIVAFVLASYVVEPLKRLTEGSKLIAKGNLKHRVKIKSQDEIGVLATSFNKMAEDLDKSTQELLQKERITTEFKLAAKIQEKLIPNEIPKIEGFDISASMNPASEMGGDIYDFIAESEKSLFFYLADVTGHGVPAGIVASIINALSYDYTKANVSLSEGVGRLNKILYAKTESNMFATMVFGKFSSPDKFTVVNAGHEPILHYSARKHAIDEIRLGGVAMGVMKDCEKLIKEEDIKMEKGDFIFLYTDGIPEAWKSEKVSLGMDGFKKIILGLDLKKSATEIKEGITAKVSEFMGNYEQKDDITLITIKKM